MKVFGENDEEINLGDTSDDDIAPIPSAIKDEDELIGYAESDRLFDVIVQAFQRIYGKRNVSIITDEEENFD